MGSLKNLKVLLCMMISAFVIAAVVFDLPVVYASQEDVEEKSYEDMLKQAGQKVSESQGTQSAPVETHGNIIMAHSIEDFYNGISYQIKTHTETMCYDTNLNLSNVFDRYYIHYNEQEPLMSGMYMVYFVSEWQMTWWYARNATFSDRYMYRYEIQINYKCSASEMAGFFAEMEQLAGELKKPTEYESVKTVHDYICESVTYDYAYKNYLDLEGFRDGTMVCNGYSMAMFNLLTNMGIDCRIVTGMANSKDGTENHAWNVVKVDGEWYNIDATWDDSDNNRSPVRYTYFLKSDYDFPMHTRLSRYDGYTRSMAQTSYPEPKRQSRFLGNVSISTLILMAVFFFVLIKFVVRMIEDRRF